MNTSNCLHCEKAYENMKGNLAIDVRVPDGEGVLPTRVTIAELDGLFEVVLMPGSSFIFNVKKEMKIYARISNRGNEKLTCVCVKPDEFTHLLVDYDYYYYKNQIRVESAVLKKLQHKTEADMYRI